jgi:GxxExxY protein
MQAGQPELRHPEVTGKIIAIFYDVYNELGYGFLEPVYEESLVIALRQAGLIVNRQVPAPVWYRNQKVGEFSRLLFDNERKKFRKNPRKSVARLSA